MALFRATGEAAYLQEAREYARAAGRARALSWSDSHALAHYEIARADPSYVAEARRHLETRLEAARGFAAADPFRVGLERLHWGSAPDMAGVALQAFWYRDLTGDGRYLALGQHQWDYLLGANPWGVCFVNGAGTTWPRHPASPDRRPGEDGAVGFWNEGPVPPRVFAGRKLTLSRPDAYAAFQSEGAVYHDDKEDYVTNEPTLTRMPRACPWPPGTSPRPGRRRRGAPRGEYTSDMAPEDLRLLRTLLQNERVLSLGVIVDAEPLVGVVPFLASLGRDALVIHVSRLARHSKGLSPGARFGAAIHAADTPENDPLRLLRVTLEGTVEALPEAELPDTREQWLERFESAALTLPLGDFTFFRLVPEAGRLVAGFGRALNLDRQTFREAAALAD